LPNAPKRYISAIRPYHSGIVSEYLFFEEW
jgi:hypothetical protein